MGKKTIGDINGWVFISVGFIVIAVSIFFYDTLKIFIAIGGIMTLYGMAKISYDQFKAKVFPKEEEGPVDLDKKVNPYIQQEKAKRAAYEQQLQQQRTQHTQIQRSQQAPQHRPIQHQTQQPHAQQRQGAHPQQHHPQQRQSTQHSNHAQQRGKYCHNCGTVIHPYHRFCNACGARVS